MTLAARVESNNGDFTAELIGAPDVRATASSRDLAVQALRQVIAERLSQGALALVDVPMLGVTDVFGTFRDDPTLREICEEAYRLRDAERDSLP
jgi:hypothetical protein